MTKTFVVNNVPIIKTLILAGYADFKTVVFENSTLDV